MAVNSTASKDLNTEVDKKDDINPATGEPWTYIAHEKRWTDDNGVPQVRQERVRMDDWPRYARENNL